MKKLLLVLVLFCAGCEITKDATGEKQVRIDPNQAAKVEAAVEGGIGVLEALAALWPLAGTGAVGLAAALAAWRKAKARLTESQTETEMYHSATAALVAAIKDYRETNPETWDKLKLKLEGAVGPDAENIIRALRGLPPKA